MFDKIRRFEDKIIKKHTSIVDFSLLGYNSRYVFLIRVTPDDKAGLKDYLSSHPNINNLHITNSEYDFLFECVFKNNREMNDFKEHLAHNYSVMVIKQHELIEDLEREKFTGRDFHEAAK